MKFDIIRQPLVPALITLITFTTTALWKVGMSGVGISGAAGTTGGMVGAAGVGTGIGTTSAVGTAGAAANSAATSGAVVIGAGGSEYLLAIPSPGDLLAQFQAAAPIWSLIITGLLIFTTAMYIGRIAVRYNLYAVSTCLPIALYAIIACGIGVASDYLAAFIASALLAIAAKNYSSSYYTEYRFDALFRASFFLGLLVIVYAQALLLVLLLPFAILIFRRTMREIIVATAGLALPILVLCYVNWGAGGDFFAPVLHLGSTLTAGLSLDLFAAMGLPTLILFGVFLLLDIFALLVFLRNLYAVGSKPRFILLYNIGVLILTLFTAFGSTATSGVFALLALPSALLLPVLFVHVNRRIAQPIYLILLIATLAYKIVQ